MSRTLRIVTSPVCAERTSELPTRAAGGGSGRDSTPPAGRSRRPIDVLGRIAVGPPALMTLVAVWLLVSTIPQARSDAIVATSMAVAAWVVLTALVWRLAHRRRVRQQMR